VNTYTVRAGDSPASIAIGFAGCPACAGDLVDSNPHKPVATHANGYRTFQELYVGEVLNLPNKWGDGTLDRLPKEYFQSLPKHTGLGDPPGGWGSPGPDIYNSLTPQEQDWIDAALRAFFAGAPTLCIALCPPALPTCTPLIDNANRAVAVSCYQQWFVNVEEPPSRPTLGTLDAMTVNWLAWTVSTALYAGASWASGLTAYPLTFPSPPPPPPPGHICTTFCPAGQVHDANCKCVPSVGGTGPGGTGPAGSATSSSSTTLLWVLGLAAAGGAAWYMLK
jgi:hypothetical protein